MSNGRLQNVILKRLENIVLTRAYLFLISVTSITAKEWKKKNPILNGNGNVNVKIN